MEQAIIWDCEFLTSEGAPNRFWCGPRDPDQILVQLGAVRLDLSGDYDIGGRFSQIVVPRDRLGEICELDAFFTKLTGITQERVVQEGMELADALTAFDAFSGDAPLWAWGRDEYQALAISCYLADIPAPIPATRFGNAPKLLLNAGLAHDKIVTLRSPSLAAHFGVAREGGSAHNAVDDAHSVALALQHLLREDQLRAEDFIPY